MTSDRVTMDDLSGRILLVEDQDRLREGLVELLCSRGFEVRAAGDGTDALAMLSEFVPDVILTDMRMEGLSNLRLVDSLMLEAPSAPIVVMTAYATVGEAVEAIKRGVHDYLGKPLDLDQLIVCLRNAVEKGRLLRDVATLREELRSEYQFGNIIGKSRVMREVYQVIRKVADARATVLIQGESGTGKELVARAVHFNGCRRDSAFVTLSPSCVPESLVASELFGHEKGAFTGAFRKAIGKCEAADGGTLFIDDVADLELGVQVGLLRFLQEMEFQRVGGTGPVRVDVRVIAASNRDLCAEVKKSRFREDLYYRLNVMPILLPPLRNRKEDIPLLVDHFVAKYASQSDKVVDGLTPGAMTLLLGHDWPGNVRELEHLIERAVLLAESRHLDSSHITPHLAAAGGWSPGTEPGSHLRLADNRQLLERYLVARALDEAHGKRTAAAEMLGITYRALRYKMKSLGYE